MRSLMGRLRSRRVAKDRDGDHHVGRRRGAGAGTAARNALARLVGLVTAIVVGLIVLGIVLVVLKANPENAIVDTIREGARALATPFDAIFELEKRRTEIAVNWGIAAGVYAIIGTFIARLLQRTPRD